MRKFSKSFLIILGSMACLASSHILNAGDQNQSLTLKIEPPYFSPNGDGSHDSLFFSPVMKIPDQSMRWRLDIKSDGKQIRRMTGPDLEALIKWDGRDKKNNIVADGQYEAKLTVWGKSFYAQSDFVSFYVDTKKPIAEISVDTSDVAGATTGNSPILFNLTVHDESPLDRWQLQILNETGQSVALFWSSGPIHGISWDRKTEGTGLPVAPGSYRAIFQAWDMAGNESDPVSAEFSLTVTVDQILGEVLNKIKVQDSTIGKMVQLPAKDLFLVSKGKVFIKKSAFDILDEVAVLLNSFPNSQVNLDGYSLGLPSLDADQDRSSLFAWQIYSDLVKRGHVKASRLSVRGRGRVAPAERKQLSQPFLRAGVEVIVSPERPL